MSLVRQQSQMSSFSVHSSVDVGRHLFILHLHVEVLKIINVVWCQFRNFRCKVNEECSTLRVTLATAQHERESAKEQVSTLQTRVNSLENLVRDLQESAEQLHSLEHDYKDALSQLETKQQLIHQLQEVQEESRTEHEKAVTDLQKKVKELESKCQLQEKRQNELNHEVQTLRQQKAEQQALLLQQQEEQKQQLLLQQQQLQQQLQQQQLQQQQQQEKEAKNRQQNTPKFNRPSATNPEAEESVSTARNDDVIQPVAAKVTEVNPLDTSTAPDSTKSHDTGYAEGEDSIQSNVSLEHQRVECGDPELNEIAFKLRLLAVDSDDDDSFGEPEDSGMDSRKPHSELVTLNDSRLSALAMRGPIQVYVAKYSYDPFEYSPNENPEAELPLSAGDYVLVLGDMDEDGFFEGELIDGRRGLVPSNFIERVAEDDLAEFHAALALSGGHNDSNNKLGHSPIDSDTEDMAGTNYDVMNGQHTKNILNNNNNNTYEPPHPQQLSLERQLTTSVLISWWPPDGLDPSAINAYHVYLDGVLKMTVKATERTKALLENVDANQNHRVSVRCLSNQGQSKDAQCTMLIGRDVLPVPSDLGVRSVTHDSATVTWLPGNSSCSHAILMNGREVKVVKPGVFHYTLTGLDPETVYRVTIATKPAPGTYGERHKWSQDKVSGNIEFKTPPKGRGVPDPPLNVQVESGPQEGTLLLTWLPVTINPSGKSNGAVVKGYVVYADGNRIKEADGPTNDHVILSAEDFRGYVPKQLTVRTVTKDQQESTDSAPVRLPHALVKELSAGAAKAMASEALKTTPLRKSPKVGATAEHTGHETDEEIEAAFQEAENSSPEIETNIAEPFEESSSSELSDIPEVEEEIGADEASQNGERSLAISQSQEKLRKSPKPAPRKVSPSAGQVEREPEFSPKQFHGQKPDPSRKDGLLTTPMIVPAIEITRDSSTERGTSFEEEIEPTGARKPTPPHDASGKPKHRQKSMEDSVEKPLPTQDPITQRYRSGTDEPSAFRSVEQGKARSSEDTRSPDSAKSRPDSAKSRPDSAKSHHRPGSSGSAKASPSHSAKEDKHADDRHLEDRHREDRHKEDRHREDRHREDRHREDRHREDRHADDRHREDRHADDRQREERHREDRHREDRHLDERHREDRHADDRHTEDRHGAHQEPVPPAKPARLTPAEYEESNDRDSISGEINSVVDDSMVRLFIALFDYDPVTMSPNVDAVDEELPFREGQILKVYGDKDADGFYRGEANGQLGYIPCNMVSEIHIDDPDLVEQLLKESQSNSTHHPNLPDDKTDKRGNHLTPNGLPPLPPSGPGRRMVALYDYDPQELSPNVDAEVELAFKQGDIVYVMGDMDEDGFFTGELHGVRGLVPSNFLQDAPLSDEDEGLESASMVSPSRSQGSMSAASRHSDSVTTLNNVGGGGQGSFDDVATAEAALHVPVPATVPSAHPRSAGAAPDLAQGSPVTVPAHGARDSPGHSPLLPDTSRKHSNPANRRR